MTAIYVIFGFMGIFYGSAILYFAFGWFKRWYHDVLGWHRPDDSGQSYDGASFHAHCKYCGKEITQDSQGNWY